MVTIREITTTDAPSFLDLCRQLDRETTFMMYEPGERTTSVEQQQSMIAEVLASVNSTIIVAEVDGDLVGYVAASGGEFNRIRHSAYVVAGVRQGFAGQGIGTLLFSALDAWAVSHSVHRLELTVRVDNEAAIRLYKRMGFDVEGARRHSLLVDGEYVDELCMAKLYDPVASVRRR